MVGQEAEGVIGFDRQRDGRHLGVTVALALLAGLAACSSGDNDRGKGVTPEAVATTSSQEASDGPTAVAATEPTPDTALVSSPSAVANVLTLDGLGALRIGKPVPKGSGFTVRGAQLDNGCETLTSPAYPSVYAMVERGAVRRITVGRGSKVKLVEGIGAGASEAEVRNAFPGFRSTPHEYSEPPAKYLTQPGKEPRLRFEIGPDGKVDAIHVGMEPQLSYVEGCA